MGFWGPRAAVTCPDLGSDPLGPQHPEQAPGACQLKASLRGPPVLGVFATMRMKKPRELRGVWCPQKARGEWVSWPFPFPETGSLGAVTVYLKTSEGCLVAQSDEPPTLGFSSGPGLMGRGMEP